MQSSKHSCLCISVQIWTKGEDPQPLQSARLSRIVNGEFEEGGHSVARLLTELQGSPACISLCMFRFKGNTKPLALNMQKLIQVCDPCNAFNHCLLECQPSAVVCSCKCAVSKQLSEESLLIPHYNLTESYVNAE